MDLPSRYVTRTSKTLITISMLIVTLTTLLMDTLRLLTIIQINNPRTPELNKISPEKEFDLLPDYLAAYRLLNHPTGATIIEPRYQLACVQWIILNRKLDYRI